MNVYETDLQDVKLIDLHRFGDDRGYFLESYNERALEEAAGLQTHFVQDNYSRSTKGVLRGLHYQVLQPQDKLIRVVSGKVYDVVVDLRKHSPTYGSWQGFVLQGNQPQLLWVPKGFAHGFLVLSDYADFSYKVSDYYSPEGERSLAWNDPSLNITWPLEKEPQLSAKDQKALPFAEAEIFC